MGSLRAYVLPCCLWAAATGPPAQAEALDPLAPLGPGQARVFSLQPGGTITARPLIGGRPVELRDGEDVQFVRWLEGTDMTDARAVVVAHQQRLVVPNEQVITPERLSRSPDGEWAVLVVTQNCKEVCHAVGWLLNRGTRRYFSSFMDPEATIAWRPDSGEVAVSSDALYVITLPKPTVAIAPRFASPRYSRDGKLLLRSRDNPQAVYEWTKAGQARKVTGPEEPQAAAQPPPPKTAETVEAVRPLLPPPVPERPVGALGRETRGALRPTRRPITNKKVRGRPAGRQGASRALALAANTRAYRLLRAGDADQALQLFEAAAAFDPSYLLPRYNAARIYAQRGDVRGCVRLLRTLKGKAGRRRLLQLRLDDAFAKVVGAPEVRALVAQVLRSAPGTSARGLSRDVRRTPAPPRRAVRAAPGR
jgi:hypothetical protein